MSRPSQPNVLLLFTDDQRFDTIAALGDPSIHTPNLDRLARRGTAFTHAHIMGGSVPAVCMPSRAMLHTGRTLYHIERQGQPIAEEHTMLGEHLRAAGYTTWGCGKWHNGKDSFNRSFSDGADILMGGMADHWNVPLHHYDPTGEYDAARPECVNPSESNELTWRPGDHLHAGKHSSELLADAAVARLRDQRDTSPWYMYVSLLAPHDPRTMPQRFLDMYDPNEIQLPDNYMPVHPFDNGELAIRDERLAGFPRKASEVRRHIAEYYAMISHLDHELGRVLDTLEQTVQADNTIVVFAGDNGLAVGQHGLMGKQSLYDHSVRVPLVFAGPGVPENERRDQLCYLIDIYPTLCELIGLDVPDSVEGQSLKPALDDAGAAGRDTLWFGYRHLMRGVRDRRYKLIEYVVEGRRETQLFDLADDPSELDDLAFDPSHQEVVERLRAELQRWREALDDDREDQGATFWAGYESAPAPAGAGD